MTKEGTRARARADNGGVLADAAAWAHLVGRLPVGKLPVGLGPVDRRRLGEPALLLDGRLVEGPAVIEARHLHRQQARKRRQQARKRRQQARERKQQAPECKQQPRVRVQSTATSTHTHTPPPLTMIPTHTC